MDNEDSILKKESKPNNTKPEQTGKSAGKVQGHSRYSKTDARYWQKPGRLKKHRGSANFSFQVQFRGRRHSFPTGVPSVESASKIAARINLEFIQDGIEATYERYHPTPKKTVIVATVGEWIKAARGISDTTPSTFKTYASSLRLIVSQIAGIKHGNQRFGPKKGGSCSYRKEVDAISLDILTPASIQKWKLAYVAKVNKHQKAHSRKTSCNSMMRQARSLFAEKIVKFLSNLQLPNPTPFDGIDFFPRQHTHYHSQIDAKKLLVKAQGELAKKDPPAFLTILLALGGGLRRGEIDGLKWSHIDFDRAVIRVDAGKTAESRGEVPIDEDMVGILRGLKPGGKGSGFVISGTGQGGGSKSWGQQYRANDAYRRLIEWLRNNGVTARKPIHELRKELGSLVTDEHGIYAASRVLRHSTVATTAAYYTDLKKRPTIGIGGWLKPKTIIPPQEKKDSVQPSDS